MAESDIKVVAAGYTYTLYGITETNGGFIGSVAGGAVAGDINGSGMKRLRGGRTAPVEVPDTEKTVSDGDDEVLFTFQFKSTTPIAGIIETAVKDQNLIALAQGTLVEARAGGSLGVIDPGKLALRNMCHLLMRPAASQVPGYVGAPKWEGTMVGRSTLASLYGALTQRTAAVYRYGITINPFDFNPYGLSMTVGTHGTRRASMRDFTFDYPPYMHCFLGDGARTEWELPFEPIYQDDGVTPYGIEGFWGNAAKAEGVGFTRSGTTITISPALGEGVYARFLMQVDPANIEEV